MILLADSEGNDETEANHGLRSPHMPEHTFSLGSARSEYIAYTAIDNISFYNVMNLLSRTFMDPFMLVYGGCPCINFTLSTFYSICVQKCKKGKRKVQGVPQSQTAALPRHQEDNRERFALDRSSCWYASLGIRIRGKTFAINLHF